ncbi:IucA/IucC family protein [Streptomyces venezuelae]|uniref:Iron transporter n=1 Tax=Streptomyces venezuelae TaxID=54571 RepID=A0A5P2BIG1_STRVZ|nr:iron transporter [Streptomyces sp. SID335]MYZ12047.1 iron transporter [Streptomyces sp. SID337]NDZ86781.1 iron transporter [Streptomyces sp. SID10115]NEA00282.1 iron transporter [Streptomyces sp. SID10116]NEB50590.1 iron transporter [Streptomyces sp. SID339]QES29877.1 iron transporter [Streptomyces venezuelae]
MNATPASEGRPQPDAPGACGAHTSLVAESGTVPRQKGGGQEAERLRGVSSDLLEHPDPHIAAQAAAVENLLRCWVRENNLPAPDHGILRVPLEASGTALLVPVHYWSATGWHRFSLPYLEDGPAGAPPVDAVTVAALLGRESARRTTEPWAQDGSAEQATTVADAADKADAADQAAAVGTEAAVNPSEPVDGADLVGRVADSVRRTATFIADRRDRPADEPDLFLAAEQSLLLGHPLHPTPKSREGLSDTESRLYSPELRGTFALHWLAVDRSVLASDSAWTERGRTVPADQLAARLVGGELPLPDDRVALPVHPWQIRELRHRPSTAALFDADLIQDLGTHGAPWRPTSSVRTLYRPGAAAMLKLSLGLRITNSRRENLRKELHRGVEVHRLLRSGLAEEWQSVHPCFDVVRDPAWLAVTQPDGTPVAGLDVMIRHNPFRPGDDATCIAGLVSPRPSVLPSCQDSHAMRSRLGETVTRLAGRTGRSRGAVATEWFLRYLETVVRPVLWLDSEAGVALEAHQQNTLLLLDPDGWPVGGRYRDNQGYYFRESRRADLERRLPGIGRDSDTFVSDGVTDERFAYYLGINNVLGLIGALGAERLADERLLLAAFRRFLADVASGPAKLRTSLPATLLDSPVLRCKANLLTRLHGLDELVGPVDTQSVYVTIPNPLHS